MPQIKRVKSLQGSCLESVALNIDNWYKIHVEILGGRKIDNLGAINGPFESLRKFC